MSYNKYIIYGKRFELFKYEREPSLFSRSRKNASDNGIESYGDDGSALLGLSSTESVRKAIKREDNTKRASVAFRRLVLCNLSGSENPILFTATYRENKREVSEAFRDFSSFIQALRYKFGSSFRYICVPEFQRRGAVHFHTLFWGLQKELLGIQRQWPSNTIDCYYWNYGFTFVKNTDGRPNLASYLAKYMAKAFQDPRLVGKKAYVVSRNVIRPQFGNVSDLGISYLLDDYCGVDNFPIQKREYLTQYLGNCCYELYNIKQ